MRCECTNGYACLISILDLARMPAVLISIRADILNTRGKIRISRPGWKSSIRVVVSHLPGMR